MGGRGSGGSRGRSRAQSIEFDGKTFTENSHYSFKDGQLYRNVAAGQISENRRPTRVANEYNIYIDSFPNAALPYSNYHIADKVTGRVYSTEVTHGIGNEKEYLNNLVSHLKTRRR